MMVLPAVFGAVWLLAIAIRIASRQAGSLDRHLRWLLPIPFLLGAVFADATWHRIALGIVGLVTLGFVAADFPRTESKNGLVS